MIAPKSHDKLAPLVAMPPQSGKRIFPDLGRGLPCEIQGEFSARFRPSASGAGLEDRKRDAKDLLAEYEKSMESLGNRRPKYTEYPRMFGLSPLNNFPPLIANHAVYRRLQRTTQSRRGSEDQGREVG